MYAPSGKISSERPSSNACLAILSPTSKYSLPPCTSSGMVCSAFSITSRRTAVRTELFLYANRELITISQPSGRLAGVAKMSRMQA